MKTLEFIYQEKEIHFLVNPNDKNVMINATEMAKMFGKRTNVFLKTDHAKAFIEELERTLNGGRSETIRTPYGVRIIENRSRNGVYFNEILALKFAAWLDPKFEIWVYQTIRELLTTETKVVKSSISEIKTAEQALAATIAKAKADGNEEALAIIKAFENRDLAKRKKDQAMREFAKQMKMEL